MVFGIMDKSRKLPLNFPISTFLGRAPSPMSLQIILMEARWMLVVPEWSLGAFLHNGWPTEPSRVLQTIIQVLSLESKRMLVAPERSLGGF